MANCTPERFAEMISRLISIKPSHASALANKLIVGTSTVKEWAESISVPSDGTIDFYAAKVMVYISTKFRKEVCNYVCHNESEAKTLAREFEVAVSTVARWARGDSEPLGLIKLQIMEFMAK